MNDKTLVFPIYGSQVLLGMKKVRFGAGKWNGFGGAVEEGETPLDGAIRELYEEAGIKPGKIDFKGIVKFRFSDKSEWDQDVHLYLAYDCVGEPIESDEMLPKLFPLDSVPYAEMWAGDEYWLEPLLNKNYVEALVTFNAEGDTFEKVELYKPEKKTFLP